MTKLSILLYSLGGTTVTATAIAVPVVGTKYGWFDSSAPKTTGGTPSTPTVPKATEQSPSSTTGEGQDSGGTEGASATGGSGQGAGSNGAASGGGNTDEKKGTGPTACATHSSTDQGGWWNSWRDFM